MWTERSLSGSSKWWFLSGSVTLEFVETSVAPAAPGVAVGQRRFPLGTMSTVEAWWCWVVWMCGSLELAGSAVALVFFRMSFRLSFLAVSMQRVSFAFGARGVVAFGTKTLRAAGSWIMVLTEWSAVAEGWWSSLPGCGPGSSCRSAAWMCRRQASGPGHSRVPSW